MVPSMTEPEDTWFADTRGGFAALHRIREALGQVTSSRGVLQMFELEDLGKTLAVDGHVRLAESDEHIRHEMFVHPAMTWLRASSVLVFGGGDGCLVRELLKWRCVERVLVLEPSPELVQLCREHVPEWTSSLEDPRVELRHEDAVDVRQLDETFDLVLADLELDSRLFGLESLEHVRELLNFGGLLVAQTGGLRLGRSSQDQAHVDAVQQLLEAFEDVRVAYEYVPSLDVMWTVTVASSCRFCVVDHPHLTSMWSSFENGVWDDINQTLDDEEIVTAYYDGITHMRLFSPPLDQGEVYGWALEQGDFTEEPCSNCDEKSGSGDDEGRAE